MRARVLIGTVSLAAAVLAGPAASGETRSPESEAYVDDTGNPTVAVAESGTGSRGTGSGGDDGCVWEVVVEDDSAFVVYDADGVATRHSATGRWLQKVCDGRPVLVGGDYLVPEGGEVDVAALAAQARASVAIPAPDVASSPDADRGLVVRVPTWFWVTGGWWRPYTATASTGRVTATVTAAPVATRWSFGDGHSRRCAGAGTPWRAGLPDSASGCTHTYTTSSGTGPGLTLTATVTLDITWTSNVGAGGTLDPLTRTSTRQVAVGEIQAIGSN